MEKTFSIPNIFLRKKYSYRPLIQSIVRAHPTSPHLYSMAQCYNEKCNFFLYAPFVSGNTIFHVEQLSLSLAPRSVVTYFAYSFVFAEIFYFAPLFRRKSGIVY